MRDDSEEEDPEVQVDADTEVIEDESEEEEDPEEIQLASDIRTMEEGTDMTTEQVIEAISGQAADEGAEGDVDEPVDDAIGSSGLCLPPPLPESPFPDGCEELTPETELIEIAPPEEPLTPPHVPIPGIPVCVHNWAVDRMYQDMTILEGRLVESRAQLASERAARQELLQRVRQGRQGGVGAHARRYTRRRLTRIELRARMALRTLPTDGAGRVSRVAAEEIFRHAMIRARALARADDRYG